MDRLNLTIIGTALIPFILWVVGILVVAIIGEFCVGYSLDILVGASNHGWHDVNLLLRLFVGLLASEVAIPLTIILFILSLVMTTPLL